MNYLQFLLGNLNYNLLLNYNLELKKNNEALIFNFDIYV